MSAEKETYIRRRAFNKIHVNSWLIYLEKDGFVRCPFQNCNFMAFDVNEMCEHYGFCKGDSSFANYVCDICKGCTVSEKKLQEHRARAHNITILSEQTETTAEADKSDPGKPSRVMVLSWGVFFEKHKYIKCSNCQYLANTMSEICRHFTACKQERKFLVYVCPECKGRSNDVGRLIQHLERAHTISKRPDQFNHISRNMVQFWEKELREEKYATCLHINSAKERDCEFIDVDLFGINEHSQMCKGPQQVTSSKQWYCQFCLKWTTSYEKLTKHQVLSHRMSLVPSAQAEQKYSNPPQNATEQKQVLNNLKDSARSQQFSRIKKFVPFQNKNATGSYNKEPVIQTESIEKLLIVEGEYSGESSRENSNTFEKHVKVFNVDNPDTIVPDMLAEECPFTICDTNQRSKEIFLDLVEDKLVARQSVNTILVKDLDNIFEKEVCKNQDSSMVNMGTGVRSPDTFIRSEAGPQTIENLNVEEDKLTVTNNGNNTAYYSASEERKSGIVCEETDFGEKCIVNSSNYLKNSIPSEPNHDNIILPHDYKCKKFLEQHSGKHNVSLKLYQDEIEVEDNIFTKVEDRVKEESREEDIVSVGSENVRENLSKSNKHPCHVLFKDEPSSDEEELSEKSDVEEDIKNLSVDWYSGNRYNNKSPKNYTRRKSSEDRSPPKKSGSLCKESDPSQSSIGSEDIGRTSVINYRGKKSYENNFKNQMQATKNVAFQSRAHFDESQEEASKNSEKNDKLMLQEHSCDSLSNITLKSSDQIQTSIPIIELSQREGRTSKIELFSKFAHTINEKVVESEGKSKQTSFDRKTFSLDSKTVEEVCYKQGSGTINSILCEYELRGNCEKDESKLLNDTLNLEKAVQETASKSQTCVDSGDDSLEICEETKCLAKQSSSVNSYSLQINKSIAENKIAEIKPRVVSFFYSGKLMKPISVTDSPKNKKITEDSEKSMRLEVLRNTLFSNKPKPNCLQNQIVGEPIKHKEEENPSQQLKMVTKTSTVHENDGVVDSNSKFSVMSQIQSDFNVDSSVEEARNTIFVETKRSLPDVGHVGIESECSSEQIKTDTSSDVITIVKNADLLKENETYLGGNLKDLHISSDFNDNSPLDEENFLGTDEELDKDKFFNGFQEISENVYSTNRRFRQFLNRMSESENEEWYINAGNLSLDIRKDLSLSHDKLKNPTSFEYDPPIISNEKLIFVVEDNNLKKKVFASSCKEFVNANVENSKPSLQANQEITGEEIHCSNIPKIDKEEEIIKNHNAIGSGLNKQEDLVKNVTNKINSLLSSSKESNITAPLNIATKRSFKISLSIDNLKMPSKIGTEKLSPQKLDKINIYEPTEGIRNANKKGVRSSSINRESVEEDCLAIKVKPDSYNLKNHPKNIKSNRSSHPIETSNSKSSLLTTTTADQSSSIDEPVGNLNRDIVLNASAILRKRDQKNTEIEKNKCLDAKAKDKKENVLVKEMKATIFDKCNNRKQTESNTNPNKASKHYDYVPASNISSNSQLKISKDECSNQVIKRVHSNFLGATVSSLPLTLRKDKVNVEKSTISTSIGYKYSEDKDKHKFKSDDMTQSDNETLSDVQEVGHSSVKTVLCAKDNLLTEGFSPHDHILEESFENEKMKSAMEDNLVTEGLSPHELIQDESLKTEKMKSAKEAHLETIKLDMKTGQHYANTINSDVYNSKKINSIIKSRDSNITTKKVRRQESYKDERGIKAFVNETTEMDTEKLCETASVGLSDKNVNITDNCTAEEQSSSVLYSKNSFALDKGMNPEYCTTPKRRGRPPKRKLNEITAIADQNEESNNFNEDDYDNELLLSIYSEDVEKILVCGLFEENQDKNLQYRMGLPEFQNGGKIEQALTKSIKDVLPNKQKEVEDDSASGPSEMKIPKKRGRKPKLKSEINTSKDADNTQAFSTVLLDGKAECTRKSTDSSADKSCDISEIKVPKRRGRPPKLKTEISSSQCIPDAINQSTYEKFNVKNKTCKDLLSHSNTDIACDINEVKIPKKRGRKPKLKTQRDNSVSSQNTTESPLKEVQDETVLNGMVKESTTGKLCDVEIVKVPKKRGRPRIKKPESLENGTSSIFEKRDYRSNRYSKINSDVHDEANEVSGIADIDCDSSVANELLDTDVIMINEEKLRRSLTLDRKSRKCKVTPEKSVTNDDDQSDGSRSEESFSSDDSEDDMSYRQPPKRRKKDTIQKSSDGNIETVCKLENKNKRSNVKNSVEKTFFKTKHHGNDKVVCGACKTEMTYSTYRRQHAIFKHYMLTWLEGEESPMDMNNQRDIESRLWFCKKQMRRTPFRCPVCNLPKLSAVGFYSHIRFCGKDHEEKKLLLATCDICGTKMMPCSLKAHMNSKHSDKPSEEASKSRRDVLDQSLIVRGPRAAATRAVQVIQKSQADNQDLDEPGSRASSPDKESQLAHLYTKPSNSVSPLEYRRWKDSLANNRFVACTMEGCNFSASTTIQFRKHYITCPFRPPRLYKCRNCDFTSANHEQMLVHVEKKHVDQNFYQPQGSEDDSSEGSDDEQKPTKVSYSGSILPFKFLKLAKLARQRYASTKRFFTPAMTWTFELRQKMFARETLYPEALCKPVKAETVCTHLPELTESISFHGSDGAWQRLQRFQSCLVDGVPILFAGGPVWATSWAPVPHPEEHQYLAVAAHTSVEITHKMSSLYNYPGLIQIWALGALSNTHTGEVSCPRLVVGLAQQRGPVWSLAWCPSGAYTQDRLGLLAAACGDGSVVVYAVPRVAPTHTTSEPVMSVKPTWEMKLGCEMMAQCTCVEWHTATPHSVIAGGFTNGMVALWDLTITSPLLKSGSAILPFKVIEAHHSAVTSVKLSCTAGNVYMMTASLDRTTKFWNLDDTRSPVSYLRKACVTDAVMTNNWLLSISAYDDVYSINNSHVTGCTFRDFFTTANSNFVLQPGTVWALSFNDWLNGCAYASEMGKVNAFFRQQLLATEDFKKVSKTAFIEDLVTCTSRSVKDGSTVNSGFGPEYQDCASSVGLAFDFRGQPKDAKTSMCSSDNMDSYPIRSFNTVSWNQNTSSFTWLAAGMQCGLVVVPRLNGVDPNDLTELDQLKDNL